MKKTLKYIVAVIIGSMLFTSCEDPFANQTIAKPTNYTQLIKQDTSYVAVLKTGVSPIVIQKAQLTDSLALITVNSLPTLLDTAARFTYQLQLSNTSSFSTYKKLASSFSGKAGSDVKVGYQSLNDTLKAFLNTPDPRTVYARYIAYVVKGTTITMVTSKTLTFQATPYVLFAYNEITPKPYYIIGLADGSWNNSVAGLGVSMYPLSLVPGNAYHSDGSGEYTFTGYFNASRGFKLIRDIGNWNEQWGMTGGVLSHNDGGSGNITVPSDGYYTINLNSIDNTLTIVPATAPGASYTSISLIGEMTNWSSDIDMPTAEPTLTGNNHIWYTTYTFTTDATSNGGCKFRANAGWVTSWGGPYFPNAIGTSSNGANIIYKAGTYTVIFNDIDGTYYFIKQ
ncbi:MAG: SusF/SusE family outer membrane protein [Bacteroidota bacterium]|nr:SusF/SusE family outer membrane protein [Bacteroidota bacterium]